MHCKRRIVVKLFFVLVSVSVVVTLRKLSYDKLRSASHITMERGQKTSRRNSLNSQQRKIKQVQSETIPAQENAPPGHKFVNLSALHGKPKPGKIHTEDGIESGMCEADQFLGDGKCVKCPEGFTNCQPNALDKCHSHVGQCPTTRRISTTAVAGPGENNDKNTTERVPEHENSSTRGNVAASSSISLTTRITKVTSSTTSSTKRETKVTSSTNLPATRHINVMSSTPQSSTCECRAGWSWREIVLLIVVILFLIVVILFLIVVILFLIFAIIMRNEIKQKLRCKAQQPLVDSNNNTANTDNSEMEPSPFLPNSDGNQL